MVNIFARHVQSLGEHRISDFYTYVYIYPASKSGRALQNSDLAIFRTDVRGIRKPFQVTSAETKIVLQPNGWIQTLFFCNEENAGSISVVVQQQQYRRYMYVSCVVVSKMLQPLHFEDVSYSSSRFLSEMQFIDCYEGIFS